MFRLLAPSQVAKSENVYSYKYILDCVKQNRLLDISSYRLVCTWYINAFSH